MRHYILPISLVIVVVIDLLITWSHYGGSEPEEEVQSQVRSLEEPASPLPKSDRKPEEPTKKDWTTLVDPNVYTKKTEIKVQEERVKFPDYRFWKPAPKPKASETPSRKAIVSKGTVPLPKARNALSEAPKPRIIDINGRIYILPQNDGGFWLWSALKSLLWW